VNDGRDDYDLLRSGFTAAVSHELRTPLARLLSLLETAELPDADVRELLGRARTEVEQMRELVDDVLFLGELESGAGVVALGPTAAMPVLEQVVSDLSESATRAGLAVELSGNQSVELPLRARMLRVVAENLVENSIRYAGDGATLRLTLSSNGTERSLVASDNGVGVEAFDVPRLFERFFRSDRARHSRGTGLGLAIVKHVVTSAGGAVEARGGPRQGLEIRCTFPGG
jgi:two-component system, OmpR family, phosphate regulon sensor histidine kinase PhoR